jgi:hypothetical protein
MKIGDKLLKELSKRYEPDSTIDKKFGRYDLTFRTDPEGNPIAVIYRQPYFERPHCRHPVHESDRARRGRQGAQRSLGRKRPFITGMFF